MFGTACTGFVFFLLLLPNMAVAAFGVRHEVSLSLSAMAAKADAAEDDLLSVTLLLFISSHSIESNFANLVRVPFDHIKWPSKTEEKQIWHEDVCHQRRGYPKITALAVRGTIIKERGDFPIDAQPRLLGKLLPKDELTMSQAAMRQEFSHYQESQWHILTNSGLDFLLSLKTYPCFF